ncbi:hypothetical protein NXC14_PA00464 (plasmid) [Rhizobium sp. NXC14]|nr:hypothetical protein NXC14_PA00464 [Rhizobium sp. NXC14]
MVNSRTIRSGGSGYKRMSTSRQEAPGAECSRTALDTGSYWMQKIVLVEYR